MPGPLCAPTGLSVGRAPRFRYRLCRRTWQNADRVNEAIATHCARPPRAVLFDEAAGLLLDVASGKTLALGAAPVADARPDGTLALTLEAGRAVALTPAGIGFAPGFLNTGPLAELPALVAWSDFVGLMQQLKRELYGHVAPSGATVRVLMCCLAIVDGARAAGFDVRGEEAELEWHLRELERVAPS